MFNVEVQDALDVARQLVDDGEVPEDRSSVSDDDGPHWWRQQHTLPWYWHVLRKRKRKHLKLEAIIRSVFLMIRIFFRIHFFM